MNENTAITPDEVSKFQNSNIRPKSEEFIQDINTLLLSGKNSFEQPASAYYRSLDFSDVIIQKALDIALKSFKDAGWKIEKSYSNNKFDEGRITYTFIRND